MKNVPYERSFQYKYPELSKQWHPTKNGNLHPWNVSYNSICVVWWFFPYDDPKTGKHFDFEWTCKVCQRAKEKKNPFIMGKRVWLGFNDLATNSPELSKQWHPTRNGTLTPEDVQMNSNAKVWWLYPYDDLETGKHFDFEWQAQISDRVRGKGCPFLCGKQVWPGFNDLATNSPELSKQWHPKKNGQLSPKDFTIYSHAKVWWLYPYDDPETGKHFDFEWQAQICHRTRGDNCPFLSGNQVWLGFNDLATKNPKLAKQWHPTKNGELTPQNISEFSNKRVWWLYPYDDPETGKHFDFEWQAQISGRAKGDSCPFLIGKQAWPGFNDLATINPELAKQWHPTKNGKLTPQTVPIGSNRNVWWLYPYDDSETGKHFDFEWKALINNRNRKGGCPYLCGKKVWLGFNDLATINPELAKQWHPTKNGKLTPQTVPIGSNRNVWWLYPYDDPETGKHFDFEWKASINSRNDKGCPYLSNPPQKVWPGFNDLATKNPELAKQWHPTKNLSFLPSDFSPNSGRKVWWRCENFHEWRQEIYLRNNGSECPKCNKNNRYTS